MDNPFKSPAILSLCTGMRGLERGLEKAIGPLRTVAYVEIEAFIIWNLVRQMEQGVLDPVPVWSNLKTFPWEQFYGKVHGIIGGYPCTPFSTAGLQRGADDPRHLWPYIKEGIRTVRPVWCFFENVANHLNIGYQQVRSDLQEFGYTGKEGIYSAEEVGAPHLRKRLFILAVANTHLNDARPGTRCIVCQGKTHERKVGQQNWKWSGHESGNCSKDLANTYCTRLCKHWLSEISSKAITDRNSGSSSPRVSAEDDSLSYSDIRREQQWNDAGVGRFWKPDAFPARPGELQYDWESPRTIESKLGFTINGYNFREDLLRMAGNGVVDQQAEYAFLELIKQF